MGHQVTVFGGPPYPNLEDGVELVKIPSLDLYRQPDPFRVPKPREFTTAIDALEFAYMCTAGFPEPLTFSLRARKVLAERRADFDLIHDNQCLGQGLLGMIKDGWPLVATLHHPITVDRDLELSHARTPWRKMTFRRWYGFLRMQARVARASCRASSPCRSPRAPTRRPRWASTSTGSRVVPVGVDHLRFRPLPHIAAGSRAGS